MPSLPGIDCVAVDGLGSEVIRIERRKTVKTHDFKPKSPLLAVGTVAVALGMCGVTKAQDCVWGSFDSSRINYAAGPLNGSAHVTLRGIITSNGGTVAAGTPTLSASYLSDKDVFYTSLLNTFTGTLSGAEQTALQDWIAAGGTLIVTADIFPLPAYESFTSFYGVTGYTDIGNCSFDGNVVSAHPITAGVTQYNYCTESTYTFGSDAMLLGDNGAGGDFMIVMEPGTGFSAGGRILVLGDHNMFTESYITGADNILMANNIAAWACVPPGPCLDMSLSNFNAGSTAQWDIVGGNDGNTVAVVWGLNAGSTVINGTFGYCASFDIQGVNQNRLVGTATISGGTATVTRRIPNGTSGLTVLTQAAERSTCPEECMSNVITEVIG